MIEKTPNLAGSNKGRLRLTMKNVAISSMLVGVALFVLTADAAADRGRRGSRVDTAKSNALDFLRTQIGPMGLVDSFPADGRDDSYTYDNAIAALAFLAVGEYTTAEEILDGYLAISPHPSGGFLHRYNAVNGKPVSGLLRVGHNAYLLHAMNLYFAKTGKGRYNQTASGIADFMLSFQDNDGGLFGGPAITWKSTENNAGAYTAIHNLGVVQQLPAYRTSAVRIRNFLINECWQGGNFWVGKNDSTIATDVQALGALTLGAGYSGGVFWIETQTVSTKKLPKGGQVTGFDLNDDLDTVWTEGTLQESLAFAASGDSSRHERYLSEAGKLQQASGGFLEAATSGTTGFGENFEPREGVAPSAWYVLAALGENVFGRLP